MTLLCFFEQLMCNCKRNYKCLAKENDKNSRLFEISKLLFYFWGSGSAAGDSSETLTDTYIAARCKNQEYHKLNVNLCDENKPNLWFSVIILLLE
jgi:hypothetical protein